MNSFIVKNSRFHKVVWQQIWGKVVVILEFIAEWNSEIINEIGRHFAYHKNKNGTFYDPGKMLHVCVL